MALKHGRNTVVLFDGADLSGHLHTSGLDLTIDNSDTTVYGDQWRTNIAGAAGATASFDGYHDVALDDHLAAALRVDGGVLSYGPGGGRTVGDLVRLMAVTTTNLGESPSVDGVSPFSWAVATQGYIGFGQVLHPLARDEDNTTGSSVDDGAATTTGWTAHLHVTDVEDGSWEVKLEDSANNSAWADVTGGTFAAATAAGGQRLVSAGLTTTLRRYVRYTATRTGGTAGDGITFFLAYSRNREQ